MKLSLEIHDTIYTVETSNDPDVTEMAVMFRGLLVNAGFHPSCVEALFDVNTIDGWNLSPEECSITSDQLDEHLLTNQMC